ncbi:hypothetical protein A3Q34_17275 [Colwellia sp. PAMC 20917]|nr:hypothetical protein A3Q34_17275 [Colwellia sp. PAMC 20917]
MAGVVAGVANSTLLVIVNKLKELIQDKIINVSKVFMPEQVLMLRHKEKIMQNTLLLLVLA